MLYLQTTTKSDPRLRSRMAVHYSHPQGFVGRSICYAIFEEDIYYGHIVGGSTPKYLPGVHRPPLLNIVNNIFFHVEKVGGAYPLHNFVPRIIAKYRTQVEQDWYDKYGDYVQRHESLVEIPRAGDCYLRDGWELVGQTKGQTCKRVAGISTDSWSGKRVWDTINLRPKLVFAYTV